MIISNEIHNLSSIAYSVVTLIALMIYELTNQKFKIIMKPFVIILVLVFFILAGIKIYSMG